MDIVYINEYLPFHKTKRFYWRSRLVLAVGTRAGASPARRAVVNRTRFAVSALRASIPWRFCPHSRTMGGWRFPHEKAHSSCDQAWPGGAEKAGYASYQQCSRPSCGWSQLGLSQRIGAEMARLMRIGCRFAARSGVAVWLRSSYRAASIAMRWRGVLGLILARKNADPAGWWASVGPVTPSFSAVKAAGDEAIRLLAAPFIEDQSLHVFVA